MCIRDSHYVVKERGQETTRKTTEDEEQLLYWVFFPVTSQKASYWELQNRTNTSLSGVSERTYNRLKKHQELMALLDESWGEQLNWRFNL